MTRQQHRYSDAFDENGMLKDGRSVRIPMRMRDALAGTGSHGPRGEQPGDLCTIDGREGTLRMVNGELQCVPLKSQDAKPQFTDGHTTDQLALHRPGFRIPIVNDRRAVTDAYRRVELGQTKAYRLGDSTQCSECFGSGEDEDGADCEACEGTGVMPDGDNEGGYDTPDPASDSRTLDQLGQDHRQKMDRLYLERDAELANAWRRR
jgi:hypothetical protein